MFRRTFFVLSILVFAIFCQNNQAPDANYNSTTISVDPQNPSSSASISSNSNQYGDAQANSNANLNGNSGTGNLITNTYTTPEGSQGSYSSSNISTNDNDNNNANSYSTSTVNTSGNASGNSFGSSNIQINGRPVSSTSTNNQIGQNNNFLPNNNNNIPTNNNDISKTLDNILNNAGKNNLNNQINNTNVPVVNGNLPDSNPSVTGNTNNTNSTQIIITVVPLSDSNSVINSNIPLTKIPVNYTISYISVGPSANILFADNSNNVYEYQQYNNVTRLLLSINNNCTIIKIVTTFNGQPYILTSCGTVYFRDPTGSVLQLNTCARDIDVGVDGQLVKLACVANNNGEFDIQRLLCNGNAFFASIFVGWNGFNCNWSSVGRSAIQVYNDDFGRIYAIRSTGIINFLAANGKWNALEGLTVKSLAVDNSGNLYAIDNNNILFAIDASNFSVKQLASGVRQVSAGPFGRVFVLDSAGNAFFMNI